MNTLCLVTSRMAMLGALGACVALFMTGHFLYLVLLFVLAVLSLTFHFAYSNYHRDLRKMETDSAVEGLADVLEPEE